MLGQASEPHCVLASSIPHVLKCALDQTELQDGELKGQKLSSALVTCGAFNALRTSDRLKRQLESYDDVSDVDLQVRVIEGNDGGQRFKFKMVCNTLCTARCTITLAA